MTDKRRRAKGKERPRPAVRQRGTRTTAVTVGRRQIIRQALRKRLRSGRVERRDTPTGPQWRTTRPRT